MAKVDTKSVFCRRVGREAVRRARQPVDQRKFPSSHLEVGVEVADDVRVEHALVHDGAGGQGADVQVGGGGAHLGASAGLDRLAKDEELALQGLAGDAGLLNQDLAEAGAGGLGHAADHLHVYGHVAPSDQLEAAGSDHGLHQLLALLLEGVVVGQEDHADTGALGGDAGELLLQEGPGDLGHDARAVAGHVIGRAGATVLHAAQGTEGLVHDLVRGLLLQVGDEADLQEATARSVGRTIGRSDGEYRRMGLTPQASCSFSISSRSAAWMLASRAPEASARTSLRRAEARRRWWARRASRPAFSGRTGRPCSNINQYSGVEPGKGWREDPKRQGCKNSWQRAPPRGRPQPGTGHRGSAPHKRHI